MQLIVTKTKKFLCHIIRGIDSHNGHKNSFVLFKKSKETSFLLFLKDFYEIFTSRLVQSKRTDLKEFYDSCFDFLM